MELVKRARVEGGQLVFEHPLGLADGTEVVVLVEPVANAHRPAFPEEEFTTLPFFGMWADREDMADAGARVRRGRDVRRSIRRRGRNR